MAYFRTTFLLSLFWALPTLASTGDAQCRNEFDLCNRGSVAQSNPDQCIQQFHSCLASVAQSSASESTGTTRTHGGHGGGYRSEAADPLPQTPPNANPAPRAMTSAQPTYVRPPRQDQDETQRCPSSAYPYTDENGRVSCVTSGDIARGMNTANRGTVENEMMGFFAELSQRKE